VKNPFYDDNDFMASLFYLDHPDFSLMPPPDEGYHTHANGVGGFNSESNSNGGFWRGVAKTQEGIKTLLALWGTPLDDPGHPLCLFSWSPTKEALVALHTHFSDAVATPFLTPTAHRTLWENQKTKAWLSTPDVGTVFHFQATREGSVAQSLLKPPGHCQHPGLSSCRVA
jgi:hypothetical protein